MRGYGVHNPIYDIDGYIGLCESFPVVSSESQEK